MKRIWRNLAIVAGVALIAVGIPLFLTPLPGGLAAIVAGLALIITSSARAQRFVRARRKEHPNLNRRLNHIEEHIPERARGPLRKTRPDTEGDRPPP
jgi:hypothetical protein